MPVDGVMVVTEGVRGCGYRKEGGKYLISEGISQPCPALPLEVSRCPCCDAGIKPSRSWAWFSPAKFFAFPCPAECEVYQERGRCEPFAQERAGILWVGGKFYPTKEDWTHEANEMGVSRRISQIPKDLVVGETWVFVGHRKAVEKVCDVCEGDGEDVENVTDPDERGKYTCKKCDGTGVVKVPGVFHRIHFDELQDVIEVEEDPEKVIAEHVAEHRAQVKALLGKAHKLLQDLGLASRSLPAGEVPQSESTSALAIASQAIDVKKHKNALIKAKEKTLPEIFKQIKEENEELARWMSAQMLPLRAELGPMKKVVGEIEDRVFTIELYAGLLEDVKQVRKGEPASMDEKLRIMQRRCYMDEECLLDYRVGGMDIKSLNAFDKWLSKKANFERLLPFPRCMVSFQIRRNQKQRVWDGTLGGLFSLMEEGKYDKLTFLYVRNGDRLYRIETGIEFGSTMFPEKDHFVLTEKMWAKRWGGRIDDDKPLMPDREYQDRCKKDDERACSEKAWAKKHKGEKNAWMKNPHRFPSWYDRDSYEPFDPSSVYYDDISEVVEKNIKEFNRIAYVVQGIFDRSEMLHPHPPTKLWDPKGFEAAVELIYDHSSALNPSAEPPSVEDYIRECNTGLRTGSATIGQEDFWERQQAEIYNRDWRVKHEVSHHRPYGNDGPGYLAKIARWYPKQKKAAFRWTRERYRDRYVYGKGYIRDPIPCSTKVPAAKLFNVDAYKPGDFRQFFQDPRTRAQYLKWVCLLLDSEKYHAGKLKIGKDK